MIKQYAEFNEKLLPILKCISCDNNRLELVEQKFLIELPFPVHKEHIVCKICGARYPITEDLIPIIWSPVLREHLMEETTRVNNVGANIAIYNAISDNYQLHTRQYPHVALRIQNAVRRIISPKTSDTMYHLDLGCGPGHVLGWLREFGFLQIGLDVSINNLRNARKNTQALVVCGDATNMPFADKSIELITESSVLHHIADWKSVIIEACRICKEEGGILLDSEPSREQMAWGPVAIAIFNARFPFYKLLSYIKQDKYIFRDIRQAKLNRLAEIHHQPGTGFPLQEIRALFEGSGFSVDIVISPSSELESVAKPGWKGVLLSLFSGRNPWNTKYGSFIAIAERKYK